MRKKDGELSSERVGLDVPEGQPRVVWGWLLVDFSLELWEIILGLGVIYGLVRENIS